MTLTVGSTATSSSLKMTPSWVVWSAHLRDGMPSRRTWTSSGSGLVQTSWGSTRHSAGSCTWVGASPGINTGWGMKGLRAALPRRTWGTGAWKAGHEPATCAHNPEGQPHLGLHQEKCGQQVEGGDSVTLLCSDETSPGVLCPALEPSVQERHGPSGVGPNEGQKNNQRAGAPLLWGKTERVGAVQPGEEKAPGRLLWPFST